MLKKIIFSYFFSATIAYGAAIPKYDGTGPNNVYYLTGAQDALFDGDKIWGNQDGWSEPYIALRDAYLSKGYNFYTSLPLQADNEFRSNLYMIFIHNTPSPRHFINVNGLADKCIVLALEPPHIWANNYNKCTDSFKRILTWDDNKVDNKTFFKYFFVQANLEMIENIVSFDQKKLCTMIASNKDFKHPHSLYPKRREAISFFEKSAPQDFDLYGWKWGKLYKTYQGPVQSKTETFKKYKFAICYENIYGTKGYISEKIFGVFVAGCVPIYWGADNITDYIPKSCFIDKRDFEKMDELYNYISKMPEEEYNNYLDNIKAFLNSSEIYKYSIENFVEILTRLAENKLF